MRYEKSCGAVVFTRCNGEVQYVLAQSLGGHYGFPKGHVEAGETEKQTALREVFEEVGLKISLVDGFREVTQYRIPDADIQKQVVFFLGEYADQNISAQETEIRHAPLVSYEEALQLLTHEDNRRVLTKAHDFLDRGKNDEI